MRPIKPLSARPLTSTPASRQRLSSAGTTARSPRGNAQVCSSGTGLLFQSAGPRTHREPAAFIPNQRVRDKLYKATCRLPAETQNTHTAPSKQCPACGSAIPARSQVGDPAVPLRDDDLQRQESAVEALQREADLVSNHQHQKDEVIVLQEQLARERKRCAELQKMCERQQADLKAAHQNAEMLSAKLGDLVDMDQALQVDSLLA